MKALLSPRHAYPAAGLLLALAAWHLCVVAFQVSPVVLPKPALVFQALIAQRGLIASEGWVTLKECLGGFSLSLAVGILLATVMTASEAVNLTLSPLIVATQSVPKVAVAPLILVWLGVGIESRVAVAFLVSFLPILMDTAAGLRATPPELVELARSLRASRLQILWKIRIPAALPFIFSGARVAVTLSVVGAVVGEFIGSTGGLGYLLLVANSQVNAPLAWACAAALGAVGVGLFALVCLAQRLLMPWADDRGHA